VGLVQISLRSPKYDIITTEEQSNDELNSK
ncbi:unnamed protein product, partial [Rotaria sordida]